jgi:hypothetical protein
VKLLIKVKKVYKKPQKRSKVVFLSAKKKVNIKKVFINNFKTKDLRKKYPLIKVIIKG